MRYRRPKARRGRKLRNNNLRILFLCVLCCLRGMG
jgi:hypothetical protein